MGLWHKPAALLAMLPVLGTTASLHDCIDPGREFTLSRPNPPGPRLLQQFQFWDQTQHPEAFCFSSSRGSIALKPHHHSRCAGRPGWFQTDPSYSLQQQLLLDVSLAKLQLGHRLVKPNLCHSVLTANTAQQIQEKMTQDGTWQVVVSQRATRVPLNCLLSMQILCSWARGQGEGHSAPELGPVSELSQVTLAQVPKNPQSSVLETDSPQENRGSFWKLLDQIFETLENKKPSSVEKLFSDRDGSYYDLDMALTGMCALRLSYRCILE
ncbi:PREDICTED: cell division cycle-associated protein 4-like, partial [Galeopterus variegatus]|uniref:Cell division cycle-associated protein 4-like n=1 Tax=Galeopterus variegatus TaxID=482537 RepID=A0ABM0RIM0_GALVR